MEGLAGDDPREINADFDDKEVLERIDSQVRQQLFEGLETLNGVASEKDRKSIVKDLTNFIDENFRTDSKHYMPGSDTIKRQRMANEAKALLKGEKTDRPPRLNDDSDRLHLLKMLVENGYVLDFTLDTPWHPVTFLNRNKLTTYPFNHKKTVLYRGTNRHIFYNSEYSYTEDGRHLESVLDIGNIQPSAEGGGGEGDEGEVAVYLGFLEAAKRYGLDKRSQKKGGAIALEMVVDSDKLFFVQHGKPINKSDDDRLQKNDVAENFPYFQLRNLSEMHYTYSSPLNMRKIALKCLDHSETQTTKAERSETFRRRSWLMAKHYSEIPIDQIKRIWDIEAETEKPYFISAQDYLQSLRESHPEKIPNTNQNPESKIKAELIEEIRNIRKLIELLEYLKDNTEERVGRLKRFRESNKTWRIGLDYNVYLFILRWHLEKNFRTDLERADHLSFPITIMKLDNTERNKSIPLLREKSAQIEHDLEEEIDFLKNALDREISHAKANNWNEERIMKEKKFENRIEGQVRQLVERMPYIFPAGNDWDYIQRKIEERAESRLQEIFDEEN